MDRNIALNERVWRSRGPQDRTKRTDAFKQAAGRMVHALDPNTMSALRTGQPTLGARTAQGQRPDGHRDLKHKLGSEP